MLTARASSSTRSARAWIDRLAPSAAGAIGIGLVGVIGSAIETQSPIAIVVLVGVALTGLGLMVSRRRALAERPWESGRTAGGVASGAVSTNGPARSRPGRNRLPAQDGRQPWRVVASLGRVEARELACNPWFGVGVGFQIFIVTTFVVMYGDEDNSLWAETVQTLVFLCHPLVGMAVVAAHAATTRGGRDDAEELFASCPTGPTARTLSLLSTAWVPAAALAVFLAAYLGLLAVSFSQVYGPAGADAVPDLLGAVALGAGGVVLGVAVGRWVRSRLAPLVAVVTVGVITVLLGADGGGWTARKELSSVISVGPELFRQRAAWWHLAWVLGLTAVVAGVALARPSTGDEGLRMAPAVVALGIAVSVVAAVMTSRPLPPAAADRLADRVARPAAHQRCAPAGPVVAVCTYVGYGELRDRVVAEVAPVEVALPRWVRPVTLRQVYAGEVREHPPEVVRRLAGGIPPLAPGEVALPFEPFADRVEATRFLVALAALGLPVAPDEGPRPQVVAGQARGVVALRLAARGLPSEVAMQLATAQRRGQRRPTPASADAFDRGFSWPTSCDAAPVVWSAQDLTAARALLDQPAAAVTAVVHGGWDRWRDPTTGTDELLAAAGLPAVGPFDPVITRDPGSC